MWAKGEHVALCGGCGVRRSKKSTHRDKASWCLEEPTNNHKAAKWIANKEPLPYYRVTQNNIP